MADRPFLKEVYRYYFDHACSQYLFVVLDDHKNLIGRLYNKHGMVPDFEINIDESVRTGLSSYSPANPFEAFIRAAKNHTATAVNKNK